MATTTTNSIDLTLGYTGTSFKRTYRFEDIDAAALSSVKAKIEAYNASIPEADKSIFISDDFDAGNNIGKLSGIVAAKYKTVTKEPIR